MHDMVTTDTASPPGSCAGDDFPAIARQAGDALDLLCGAGIAPLPQRFQVAFAHCRGTMRELSQTIEGLRGQGRLTAQTVDALYFQFFAPRLEADELRDASRRIETTAARVARCLGDASSTAERYGQVLANFDEGVAGGPDRAALDSVRDETRAMAEANRMLEERLLASSREIAVLRANLDRAEREAGLDALTGIANRKRFDIHLAAAMAHAVADSRPLSLVMVDIDHFKAFNDTHGHPMGDQVLRLVARTLSEGLRADDLAARYGGEEFGLILPETGLEAARILADRLRLSVAAKTVTNRRTGQQLGQITLSLGVAVLRPDESPGDLIHRADEALYLAKRLGRNRVMSEEG